MPEIATIEPQQINAGDSISWKKTLSDYPASDWTLNYVLVNASAKIEISSSASGDDHLIDIDPETSADYEAGTYSWVAYVTDETDRYTLDEGIITIKPDLTAEAVTSYDKRVHAKKMIDLIESVLEGRATGDTQEYTIGNRSMKKIPMAELKQIRDQYKAEYNRLLNEERRANGLATKNRIKTRL